MAKAAGRFAGPAATSFPSACTATAYAMVETAMAVVTPPVPKLGSRLPSALYRTRAKLWALPLNVTPAATSFPSACTASALAKPAIPVVTVPPVPKVESRLPSALYRARAKLMVLPLRVPPAATSFPSACTTTA